jgi:nucleoside-diphosphate-sugar epimerase
MNVLITGAGGFIGSHLVDSQLAKGMRVTAFDLHTDRLNHAKTNSNLTIIEADMLDSSAVFTAVKGIDTIFHLASAHLDVSLPDSYYEQVNVKATRELVEIAQQNGVKKLVHCSSVGVIGDVRNPPANEETHCFPTNTYEKTKLAGEMSVLQYAKQVSFPLVVARPAWVYGPRCPRTAKLIRSIRSSRFFLFGNCKNLRHPIFIKDAIRGLELCAEVEGIDRQIFILAGEKPVTVAELVQEIATQVGVKTPTLKFPLWIGTLAGLLAETIFSLAKKTPPISRRSLDFFTKNNAYDISKAMKNLNFHPQVDLHTGLRQTLNLADYTDSIF